MFFGKVIRSLAECKNVTTQKLSFVVSITIELKNIILVNTTDNTGTLLIRNTPRWMSLLLDVFVTVLSSLVVLTTNETFL